MLRHVKPHSVGIATATLTRHRHSKESPTKPDTSTIEISPGHLVNGSKDNNVLTMQLGNGNTLRSNHDESHTSDTPHVETSDQVMRTCRDAEGGTHSKYEVGL